MPTKIEEKNTLKNSLKRAQSRPGPDKPGQGAKPDIPMIDITDDQDTLPVQQASLFGVYPATVLDNIDPENKGRVQVRIPWMANENGDAGEVLAWARIATMMAGNERGTFFIPDIDDEVLVAFEAGQVQQPFVVGALWNGQDQPPITNNAGNNKKQICSRSGIKITFDDAPGQARLTCETPQGQSIVLKDGPSEIEINDANGNKITLDATGIKINAAAKVSIDSSQVELTAGILNVYAGMSKFSGVVQCDTLITKSVVSDSYTPGAGNIW